MAVITQKFNATITDEIDPTTTQEINFTDDSHTNYSVSSITLAPYDHTIYSSWKAVPESTLLDVSSYPPPSVASYLIIKTNNPIYIWTGRAPERVSGEIDESVTPKLVVSRCLILSGAVNKIYAINPSADNSTPPLTAHIKITYVY